MENGSNEQLKTLGTRKWRQILRQSWIVNERRCLESEGDSLIDQQVTLFTDCIEYSVLIITSKLQVSNYIQTEPSIYNVPFYYGLYMHDV